MFHDTCSMNKTMPRTKIVCTLGPTSNTKKVLTEMVEAGLNVARLNFSHGTYEQHAKMLNTIRGIAKKHGKVVSILQDLQGPRIRIGDIGKKPRFLVKGEKVIITTSRISSNSVKLPITYNKLHQEIKHGHRILIVDGLINLVVEKVVGRDIHCEVHVGGEVNTHKGINLPDTNIKISSLTEKDREDLVFGVQHQVDFCGLSFVRSAKDVLELRKLLDAAAKKLKIKNHYPVQIIVKIERKEAIDNLDEIIDVTDGVMVARGDLGIELPAEDVPLLQKMIIEKCLQKSKPVIVATQMLDSMIVNPRPTRAEVSDVANAVIDHADAVMLSGETANGKYPVESVAMMRKITTKVEGSEYDNLVVQNYVKKLEAPDEAIGRIANILSQSIKAKLILVASLSGYSGRIISRYRPELPIYVACNSDRIKHQLQLSWGIRPFVLPMCHTIEELFDRAIKYLLEVKAVKKGQKIIIITGEPVGTSGNVNLIEVKQVDK